MSKTPWHEYYERGDRVLDKASWFDELSLLELQRFRQEQRREPINAEDELVSHCCLRNREIL
ncbi:MAG TPA: hypothetical protein VFY68_03570 [Nitrososphaeraceae archaeon]|nr:hypothetical protein [Nitrososphaeraceae archaeon]